MIRSAIPAMAGASLVVALAGCSLWEPSVDVKPALALNGQSLVGDAQRQYELGKQLLAQGRYAAAAQTFQIAAMAKRPPSVELLNALAICYDHLGRYDLADDYYRQALALDARNAQTLNNFGISLARRGMPERAALVLAEAARSEPKNETVVANLTEVQAEAAHPIETPARRASASEALRPAAPAVPRVERVGLGTLQLVTEVSELPAIATTKPSASATPEMENTVVSAPRRSVVQIELAAAPEAVHPVTAVRSAEPPVVVDSATDVAQEGIPEGKNAIRKMQPRIEVANGAGRTRMAMRMRGFLGGRGVAVARLTNDSSFANRKTVIYYRPGFEAAAQELSKSLPFPVETVASRSLAADIRVRLGRDLASFDLALQQMDKKKEA